MGLLYPFPVEQNNDLEDNHLKVSNSTLFLKTYGLPYLFWGYLTALLATLGLLAFISAPFLNKMLFDSDPLNTLIAIATLIILISTPLIFICFFFLEIRLEKKKCSLAKSLHIFGLTLSRRHFELKSAAALTIESFTGTPNIARRDQLEGSERHQNKGYYELYLHTSSGEKVLVDRHSRKIDLVKLKELLSLF